MEQNASLKIHELEDYLFSQTEIENMVTKREHIFEIQKDNLSLGFISLYDLKEYIILDESSCELLFVKNIDQNSFQLLFEHPLFQRRKLQIIDPTHAESILPVEQKFHILQQGQKSGPFTKDEMNDFITNREIIMNDMVSINAGQTWQKLFATPGFERRELKPKDELPRLPDEDYLKQGPADYRSTDNITDATSSLAYLGNIKKGQTANLDYEKIDAKEIQKKKIMGTSYKWLFVLSFIGIGYFLFNIKSALQSPFSKTPISTVGEHSEQLTPTESTSSMNSSPRSAGKFQNRQLNPVKPRFRTPQKSFREANPGVVDNQNGSSDPNYYYDNAAPMELDPVREQVSRETFDNGDPGPPPSDDALFNQESSN